MILIFKSIFVESPLLNSQKGYSVLHDMKPNTRPANVFSSRNHRRVHLASSQEESGEIMSDDPIIIRLEQECAILNGGDWNSDVGLMQLLNPSKARIPNTDFFLY